MIGSILMDCGCSANVAGEGWWNSYNASLSPELKNKVQVLKSDGKKFRFGGGEELPSILNVKFPGRLARKDVMFKSHMVKSNIPLLWSRPALSRAGTILDLTRNGAEILDVYIDLNLTAVGHYALDILPKGQEKAEEYLATLPTDSKEKKATLLKLHRQFGHPRLDMMTGLLKKVNCMTRRRGRLSPTSMNTVPPARGSCQRQQGQW